MWFLLILLLPILIILGFELKFFREKRIINRMHGPPTLPVIGNAHQMGNTPAEILNSMFKYWHEFGRTNYRIWIGYFSNLVISEVPDMEFILSSNVLLQKSNIYDLLHPWLGFGLLTSHGAHWRSHRKMITPSFHFKILQSFHNVMNTNSTKFMDKLRKAAAGDAIFDLQNLTNFFTLDVICETAMGVSINAMDENDSEIVTAFRELCHFINMWAFHPIKRNPFLLKFTPDYTKFRKTLKVLQDFTNNIIENRIASRESASETTSNLEDSVDEYSRRKMAFLDTLLTATIDNKPLTHKDIYEEVSTFMFEGQDTTTSAIAFAIYLLSRHPDIQKKVLAEQQLIMGGQLEREATFQEISDMKYLDLFIRETERLYPSVPFIGRSADQDYMMNGTLVPKGTTLNLFLMAMGYNDKVFPDPYRCNPERYDVENSDGKANPFNNVPFSAGPRNCIGQKFALLEIKSVVSKVVRTFEILPPLDELVSKDGYIEHFVGLPEEEQRKLRPSPNKYVPILSAVLTLKSENGIYIRLRERNSNKNE